MLFLKGDGPNVGHQVLAVMKIAAARSCLIGAVDIGANRNGYEIARALADKPPAFVCGKDWPAIAGTPTASAQTVF